VVITVSALGNADGGAIFTGYVGSAMLSGSYLAITCMTSAMSRNQVISFILAVVICFLLILPGIPPVTNFLLGAFPDTVVRLINSFSVYWHFLGFQRGVLDSRDLIFFASVAVFSLFSTSVIIRNLRAG